MLRFLPLCLLLAACGDDPAPAVVTDSDVTVVETAADAPVADASAPDAPAVDGEDAAPAPAPAAPAPTPAPAPAPAPTPAAAPIPPALAAMPGETLYYKDGQEETVLFQTSTSPTSGQFIYTPHPDIDPLYGEWSITGDELLFNGTTYTFDAADGAGTYQFQSPLGEMVLTIAAG